MYSSAYQFEVEGGHDVLTPHRHTFKIRIECEGPLQMAGDCEGMVVDFRRLAAAARHVVRAEFGDKMLCGGSEASADRASTSAGLEVVDLGFRPTVENMARHCYDRVVAALDGHEAEAVRRAIIWENESCMASYEPSLTQPSTG